MNKTLITALILVAMSIAALPSYADETLVDIIPKTTIADNSAAQDINTTHPDLKMTPDKSELIRLDKEAGSIIIGNPAHINVIADSSTTLIIVPRAIGATHFTVLDKNGQILMQRHVIVASPKENYIRIKRACANDALDCQKTSVLYCPDMCHEIITSEDNNQASSTQNNTSKNNKDTAEATNNYSEESD